MEPTHGDTAFTVPLFDEFMKRIMPWERLEDGRRLSEAARPFTGDSPCLLTHTLLPLAIGTEKPRSLRRSFRAPLEECMIAISGQSVRVNRLGRDQRFARRELG